MGDQAQRSVKGYVYRTSGDFQKTWVPLGGNQLLNISIFYDVSHNICRILCLHNNDPIINSTINSDMKLTKTSNKFAQMLDTNTSNTYGIGFEDEATLLKFEEYFEEMRWRSGQNPGFLNHSSQVDSVTFEDLRYENDRLKVALAQSCCNIKVWERELACLRETNQRLRCAIEESMLNVEKWNEQLAVLNRHNNQLKNKVKDFSLHKHKTVISRQLKDVGCRIHNAENVFKARDKEIARLKVMMERYASLDECKMRKITRRLNAAEILLLAKDKEMAHLKEKVCEVDPRLKEAEQLLLLKDKEMEIFRMKLKKYKNHHCSQRNDKCKEFCNKRHRTVGDCDGSSRANHCFGNFDQSCACISNQPKRCMCHQSEIGDFTQSQRGILKRTTLI